MKKLLIFAMVLISAQTYASKARLASLQGADHIVDSQSLLTNPAYIHSFNQFLTLEMGGVGSGAEGGFVRKSATNAKYGAYFGHLTTHLDAKGNDLRNGFISENNPVEIFYGRDAWATGISLSNVNNEASKTKQTNLTLKYGQVFQDQSWYAHVDLVSTAESAAGDKFNGAPYITLGGSKEREGLRYFGQLEYGSATVKSGTDVTKKDSNLQIGVEDHTLGQGTSNDIYYGAMLVYKVRSVDSKKITGTKLPVFLGMEYAVNSWATFRTSLQQNVLLGSVADETATNTSADGIAADTSVSSGLGLKYNDLTLDGVFTASTTGNINGTSFLTQAAVTYTF